MGKTTWQPHPGKNSTQEEWLYAIAALREEARMFRLMVIAVLFAVMIGAGFGAVLILIPSHETTASLQEASQ